MNNIRYVTMSEETHLTEVVGMMKALYLEDEPAPYVDPARFPETIRYLLAHPDLGRIVLLFEDRTLAGYSVLVQHWSNEYGGIIVLLDELYVLPAARNQGLARGLLEMVKRERPWNASAMLLEVSRSNTRAQRLYGSVGFKEARNMLMALRF